MDQVLAELQRVNPSSQRSASESIRGLGEVRSGGAATGRFCAAALACLAVVEPQLRGRDPRNVQQIVGALLALDPPPAAHAAGGRPNAVWRVAVSALESALLDLTGKVAGLPIYQMLGGAGPRGAGGLADEPSDDGSPRDFGLRTYANINRISKPPGSVPGGPGRTPRDFATYALAAKADGWDAIKLGPFDGGAKNLDAVDSHHAQAGIACLEAVRNAVGDETDVLVDVHGHFTASGALQLRDAVAPLRLFWMEDACPGPESVTGPDAQDVEESSRLRKLADFDKWCAVSVSQQDKKRGASGGPRVAGGESLTNPAHAWDILALPNTFTTLMADIVFVGGILELRRVGELAVARGVEFSPHCPWGPVALAASVHACASLAESDCPIHEMAYGEADFRSDLTIPSEKERLRNGVLWLGQRPGLGVSLNPRTVDQHRAPVALPRSSL